MRGPNRPIESAPHGNAYGCCMQIQHALVATVLSLCAALAQAHDTWFDPRPEALYLGTGDHFPKHEFSLYADALARHGCHDAAGHERPLRPLEQQSNRLKLALPAANATGCWAQLVAFDVEIGPALVEVYFKDIQADDSMRKAWAEQLARGLPWRERYVKFARVHLQGEPAREPTMELDALIEPLAAPNTANAAGAASASALFTPKAGDELSFRVLRNGEPLAGFAVQFRSELTPAGLWRRTDADGRVRIRLPLSGRWMLRGTDLRQVDSERGLWRNRSPTR